MIGKLVFKLPPKKFFIDLSPNRGYNLNRLFIKEIFIILVKGIFLRR